MTEEQNQPDSAAPAKHPGGFTQLQNQPVTLHNTVGLVFMSIMAFILLVALLRSQGRYQDLLKKMIPEG